jgi:hypothetical protein
MCRSPHRYPNNAPDFRFALGRQRIVLSDQRFVGNVGWRQQSRVRAGGAKRHVSAAWTFETGSIFYPDRPAFPLVDAREVSEKRVEKRPDTRKTGMSQKTYVVDLAELFGFVF